MKRFTKLTPAELQLMNVLWDMPEGGCAWDVLEGYDEPRPAYSTIATMLKILEGKEFLEHTKGQGKTLVYHPLISRESYRKLEVASLKDSLFGGSMKQLLRFFVQEEQLTPEEIQELLAMKPE